MQNTNEGTIPHLRADPLGRKNLRSLKRRSHHLRKSYDRNVRAFERAFKESNESRTRDSWDKKRLKRKSACVHIKTLTNSRHPKHVLLHSVDLLLSPSATNTASPHPLPHPVKKKKILPPPLPCLVNQNSPQQKRTTSPYYGPQ